jgi:hypothetical protein
MNALLEVALRRSVVCVGACPQEVGWPAVSDVTYVADGTQSLLESSLCGVHSDSAANAAPPSPLREIFAGALVKRRACEVK